MTKKSTSSEKKTSNGKRVTFACDAPNAQSVLVTGTFCDWETESLSMKQDKNGLWKTSVALEPGRHEYRFVVDGVWQDDPRCTERIPNEFGEENCVVCV